MNDPSTNLPSCTSALVSNQLQRLLVVKYVQRFICERMLQRYPKINVPRSTSNSGGKDNNNKNSNNTPSSGILEPLPVAFPQVEDFCAYMEEQYPEKLSNGEELDQTYLPENLPEDQWQRYIDTEMSKQFGNSLQSAFSGTRSDLPEERKKNALLIAHYNKEWVPFSEHHRSDGYVSKPLPFLSALSERFLAWCETLSKSMMEESSESCNHVSENGIPRSLYKEDLTAMPTFATSHEPAVFAEISRSGATDFTSLRDEVYASSHNNDKNQKITFATLKCESLDCTIPGRKVRSSGTQTLDFPLTTANYRKRVTEAHEDHAYMVRALWASTGGTKTAIFKKRKRNGLKRRRADTDSEDSSFSESDDGKISSTDLCLHFYGGALTLSHGRKSGVDAASSFVGELFIGEGEITVPKQ